ncbi:MAG TPA: hypothetical protein VFK21_02730, partial [Gammaproteobacteria bacterium]|nr:hypothetical protein [Gammaproteobacteria bacterium]
AGGNTFDINSSTAMALNGGAGNDDYVFANGVVLTGSIDGLGGVNTLDLSGYLTAIDATLTAQGGSVGYNGNTTGSPTDPITGTFSNITNLKGAATGTLTGENGAATWDLSAKTYTVGADALTFSGFSTLQGGTGSDTFAINGAVTYNLNGGAGNDNFVFGAGDVLTGTLNGGGGTDTLNMSAYTTPLTFDITGINGGTVAPVTGGFSNISTLDGGTGANRFLIDGGSIGAINGGGTNNTLDYSLASGVIGVNLTTNPNTGNGTSVGSFTGIQTLTGNDSGGSTNFTLTGDPNGDTFTVNSVDGGFVQDTSGPPALTFSGVGVLKGGNGNDTFNLTGGGYVTDINGGGGTNSIVLQNAVSAAGQSFNFTAQSITGAAADLLTASSLTMNGVTNTANLTTAISSLSMNGSSATVNLTNTGDLSLNGVANGSGSFNLNETGNILQGSGTLTAGTTSLTATTGSIGNSASSIATAISGLFTATATGGSIWIDNNGGTALSVGATDAGSVIHIASGSGMTVSGVTLTAGAGAGTALITNSGSAMTLNNVTVQNGLIISNTGLLTVSGGGLHVTGTGALVQNGSGGVTLNGNVTTAAGDAASFRSAITVNGAIAVTTGNAGASFSGTVLGGGTSSFTVNTGSGAITLGGVDMSGASTDLVLKSSSSVMLDSSITSGTVDLTGVTNKLAIGGSLTLTTDNTDLDLSHITGGIDDTSNGAHGLTIDTGTGSVSFGSTNVGSAHALRSLTIDAASMSLNGVATTAGQAYTGNVQLNSTLANSSSGDVTFKGGKLTLGQAATVNDAGGNIAISDSVNGNHTLTLDAKGSVTLSDAVGGTTALSALNVTAGSINTNAITTIGGQTYAGTVSAKGDMISNQGGITFKGGLKVLAPITLEANTMGFGGAGTVSGSQTLAIVPRTTDYTVNFGSGGTSATQLMLEADAFNGYTGELVIGGLPDPNTGVVKLPTAANITVDGSTSLGTGGELVIASNNSLTLVSGTIAADTVVLATHGALLSKASGGTPPTQVEGLQIATIADQIGATGQEINISGLPGRGAPELFIGSSNSSVFFNESPGTLENKSPGSPLVAAFAQGVDVSLNGNIQVTNSGQQSAANQQTGGLLTSGFIDVSVFQQISLYDVSGSGIALPGDQCEEEQTGGPTQVCGVQ